jgi:hypothetical protein
MVNEGVHGDITFDAAVQKKVRISSQELRVVTVRHGQEEVILLPKISFNAADDRRAIKVANLPDYYANHICALYAEVASIEAGTII